MEMNYTFSCELAHQHLVTITLKFKNEHSADLSLILPAWRPGRYERANYAANIKGFNAKDDSGRRIAHDKTEINTWTLRNCPVGEVTVRYQYYAHVINAGSTYIDETQLYVNPVNCCMHLAGAMDTKVTAALKVPSDYKTSGMLPVRKQTMKAKSLDEWYDSPFQTAAHQIQHRFRREGIAFEIAIIGDLDYDKAKVEADFIKFIDVQMKAFKTCPTKTYTFLVQATPQRHYHGVEHERGTTITLGPARSLLRGTIYEDLLAVCSHEFYHTWNVKYMRPKEMWPYDYTAENYHRAGYIIEGVTTYQGDLKLWQGGAMDDTLFLKELKTHLDRHVANMGRFNHSVRESSFDLWVDGYGASIPDRKVSIYTEGALLSMLFDIAIMLASKGKQSLDTAMLKLYEHCQEQGRGYAESDYLDIIRGLIGKEADKIYNTFINQSIGYEEAVYKALNKMGVKVDVTAVDMLSSYYGIKVDASSEPKVVGVDPVSEAYQIGVRVGMILIGVDDHAVVGDAEALIRGGGAKLLFKNGKRLKSFEVPCSDVMYYRQHALSFDEKIKNPLWKKWKKGIF